LELAELGERERAFALRSRAAERRARRARVALLLAAPLLVLLVLAGVAATRRAAAAREGAAALALAQGARRAEAAAVAARAAAPRAMGSYLLVVTREGSAPARVPVLVGRQAARRVEVRLLPAGAVPDGYLHVPGGPTIYGSNDPALRSGRSFVEPAHEIEVGG